MKQRRYRFNVVLMAVILSFCPILVSFAEAGAIDNPLSSLAAGETSHLDGKVKTSDRTAEAQKAVVMNAYGRLPLYFIENKGQVDAGVRFYERGAGHATFFTEDGVVLSLTKREGTPERAVTPGALLGEKKKKDEKVTTEALRLSFVGALDTAKITATEPMSGKVNYFRGNDRSEWRTNIPTYGVLTYKDVYKDIDIKFYGNNKNIEHDVIVRPGGDISQVKLVYKGIKGLKITEAGDLEVTLAHGKLIEKKPVTYQEIKGERVAIDGSYRLLEAKDGAFTYGFTVASYDHTKEIVIDPVLAYSTYLGGSDDDEGTDIAVDIYGNIYVTGWTYSTDFPVASPIQGSIDIPRDVFVTKLNSTGTVLFYSTYLGGSSDDFANSITVDTFGNPYVTGQTFSQDFPLALPVQAVKGGSYDAFITKLNFTGSTLLYSTYLGGSRDDPGTGIAVDASGNAYVSGYTASMDFPVVNPIQGTHHGVLDAFIVKINAAGTAFVYSTYMGGSDSDLGNAIAVDATGAVYMTGQTISTDFPVLLPTQAGNAGAWDAFVTKIDSAGASLVYSTYLGGSRTDVAYGIAVDESDNIYLTGYTGSTDFPLVSPIQGTYGRSWDVFVTKINSAGTFLVWSTYLGGFSIDWGLSIAVDASGNTYVAGLTNSTNFPLASPVQGVYGGGLRDAFVTKIDPTGTALVYSTFLGGSDQDNGRGIALDLSGNAYVTGETLSPDFPVLAPFQGLFGGVTDAFVAKITDGPLPPVTLSLTPDAISVARGSVLGYFVTAINTTGTQQCFSYWENVTLPNGSKYPPAWELFGPLGICLKAGDALTVHLTHGVPAGAPLGVFVFNIFVGAYPTPLTSEAHFNFEVTAFNPATKNPETSWRLLENGFRK